MAKFDWRRFEKELTSECLRALGQDLVPMLDASPIYAVALFGVYRELDGVLALPSLAASTEGTGAAADTDGFWGARWNPPDWKFQTPLTESVTARLETELTAEAGRGSERQWRNTEARYFAVLLNVTKALGKTSPDMLTVSDEFVAFWHDEAGGVDLARKTIAKKRFDRLFAPQVERQRTLNQSRRESPEARAAFLVTRFGVYDGVSSEDAERELISIGQPAVQALVPALADKENGWEAAHVLAMIGSSSPDTIKALRAHVGENDWFAAALGYLGDYEWLVGSAPEGALVTALTMTLQAWKQVPLDYHRLEAFLDSASKKTLALVDDELKPGRSYVEIRRDDVPEALRGLSSRHAVLRWHAASVLGNRGLGAAAGKQVLPALERALSDAHPTVRRLAVLSISYWKSAAKPYLPAIEALRNDPDESVRDTAVYVLSGDD